MESASPFQRHGVSEVWQRLALDWHCDSYFAVEGFQQLVATWTGVRPGDSVADLIFVVFFHAVLKEVVAALMAEDLLACGEAVVDGPFAATGALAGPLVFLPPTYMDDPFAATRLLACSPNWVGRPPRWKQSWAASACE